MIGKKIGKYLIKEKIAEGGMGAILRAKHPTLKKDVILKKLTLRGHASIVERFKREAQLMLEFSNDNIVQVYDHFREDGSYYIVMEYIDGISLQKLIDKKRFLSNETALLIYREVCKALHYAHSKGVIHRDIKPDNVLISKTGEVKLTDFGIARSKDGDEQGLTSAGMTLGTPTYMSPEQIDDSSKVDNRSDIYSMGVLLYVMVTGKSPFPSNLIPQTINAIQKGKYINPKKLNPRIISTISRIVKKSMDRKKNNRYSSIEKIIKIIDRKLKKHKTDEEINNTLMEYAYRKKADSSQKSEGSWFSRNAKGLIATFTTAAITAGFAFYLYINNYHYEYLYGEKYGAVKIVFNAGKKKNSPDEFYKDITIFKKRKSRYREVKSLSFDFTSIEDKRNLLMETDKLYLESGRYRIKAAIGNQLLQKDFFLYPRTIQKIRKKTEECLAIEVFNRITPNLPVRMDYSIKDNNADITRKSKLYIKHKGRWTLWRNYKRRSNFKRVFVSGRSYSFKAVAQDYYPRYARVQIHAHKTYLNLQLELDAVPGYIYLKSSHSNSRLYVNDSEYYLREGNGNSVKKYTIGSKRYKRYALSPGLYTIKVELDSNITGSTPVRVASGKRTRIRINVNNNNEINFIKK